MSEIRSAAQPSHASQARFDEGLAAHQQGRLQDAERLYREALEFDPRCFDAIHYLGVIALQTGRPERAAELISQAIALDGGVAAAHSHLGLAQNALRRHEEALSSFDKAIALKGDYVEAYSNRGNALQDLSRLDEALASYDLALKFNPSFPDALANRGNVLQRLGRFAEAIASYDAALALDPSRADMLANRGAACRAIDDHAGALASYDAMIALEPQRVEAWFRRANALMKLKRLDEALASYDRAIALQPDSFENYNNRGNVLLELGRFREAVESYDHAIALRAESAEAHYNRAKALQESRDLNAAVLSYRKAIELDPELAPALSNLGNVLNDVQGAEEAIASYEKALALKPDFAPAHNNLGNVLDSLLRLDEALAHFDRALELQPDFPDAAANKGMCLLRQGRFDPGFRLFEQRKNRDEYVQWRAARSYPQKVWTGEEDIAGKTLFVYWEQGLGDTIMFSRLLPLAERLGARVVVSAQNKLHRLLKTLGPSIELIGEAETAQRFDFHCSLVSMALAFALRPETIPAETPYLRAEPWRVELWRRRIGAEGFRIGIAWQGNRTGRIDLGRSFEPREFAPLARIPGVRLIRLQKYDDADKLGELPADVGIESLGDEFDSGPDAFLDSAAVMENLDLVVSSDSAIVHLAGALARPVWTALKFAPDWRWLLNRDDSPWYPTMRLFRQKRPGDWAGVFHDVAAALPALIAAKQAPARTHEDVAPRAPVSWGELIDKITILEIKSERLTSESARVNVHKELALLSEIAGRKISGDVAARKAELRAINADLWEIEDRIREMEARQEFDADFIALARSVYRRNDARARVKRALNDLLASEIVEEKSYASY